MKAVFIELPAFERHRKDYLDDDAFSRLQEALMGNPEAARSSGCSRYTARIRCLICHPSSGRN
jgi:hypothetical protein